MDCKHEQIRSTNCALFCMKCGAELPADFLTGKNSPKAADAAETPVKQETAPKKTTRKKVK